MLSISARGDAAGAAAYYQHLESDKTAGLEDYYSQNASGYFLGRGAEALGLEGPVSREDFVELASGCTPAGDVQGAGENHRAGWDLTFSAPKSASILWATADEQTREKIEIAHDKAVARGLEFMENHATYGRRGARGETHEKVGLVVAAYRHGTSRETDPQLHVHALVFNVSPRQDGTVGAIESKYFYEWKMAGGAAYRAELAQGLKDLGYAVERDGSSFKVVGIPQELCDQFSKRRKQIESALKEHGATSAKASEVAALSTRQAKHEVSREALRSAWQATAKEIAPEWRPEHCLNQPVREVAPLDIKASQAAMTQQHSTLSEAQMYASIGQERQVFGGIADIEKSVHQVKADRETVALVSRQGERYTTTEMRALEEQMVDRAVKMAKAETHGVAHDKVQAAIDAKPTLSQEQKAAVEHITKSNNLAVVQGDAGTGKSFMLSAAKDAWEAEGYRVRGASLSGKAAQELQQSSGIQSTTIARLEMDTRGYTDEAGQYHEPTDKLTLKDVLVVDEAGMSGSRQTAALIEYAERAGAKVVLIGDSRQLQAIAAGSAFRAVAERTGAASLVDIRRQEHEADRQAVRDFRDGRADQALENFSARGRVHEADTSRHAKEETGRAVAEDLAAGKRSLGITGTRQEARDVNEAARAAAKEKGLVKGDDLSVSTANGERQFAEGDRVLFCRNNRDLDVKNGDLGTVKAIQCRDGGVHMTVQLDRGDERSVDTQKYDHLDLGYAVTTHKAQGSTVDRCHVMAADNGMSSREWSYVAGSRAREETHIHGDRSTLAELAPAWSKARQKDVSTDYQVKPEKKIEQPKHDKQHARGPALERIHEWTR